VDIRVQARPLTQAQVVRVVQAVEQEREENVMTRVKPFLSVFAMLLMTILNTQAQVDHRVSHVLFETGFEEEEGYIYDADLIGQNGWIGFAGGDTFLEDSNDGSTGLVSDVLQGQGQHAYIGFVKPNYETSVAFLSLLQPANHQPIEGADEILRFSVSMGIMDSTNDERDNFRWSAYNTEGFRLFSLDFDNETKSISYALDNDEPLQSTGFEFDNNIFYDLRINVDLLGNTWTALVGEVVLVDALPLTTKNSKKDIGDMDAVWAIYRPELPGDNYMVFDNYRLEVLGSRPVPPVLIPKGHLPGGGFVVQVKGVSGMAYRIESTKNLQHWEVMLERLELGGSGHADWVDESASDAGQRFYRLVHLSEGV
jgi:hypothetical protein